MREDPARCRAAMRPGARIAIIELIVGEITDPGPGGLMAVRRLSYSAEGAFAPGNHGGMLISISLPPRSVISPTISSIARSGAGPQRRAGSGQDLHA